MKTSARTHKKLYERLAWLRILIFQRDRIACHAAITAVMTINLFPSGPCGFAFRVLAAWFAGIFLKFVRAIQ